MNKTIVFLDFEFTWLDNSLKSDHEVIWMSYIIGDQKQEYRIYNSNTENTVWSFLVNKITREEQSWKPFFSKEEFLKEMKCENLKEFIEKYKVYWYWISTDILKAFRQVVLKGEVCDVKEAFFDNYNDLKEMVETNSLYEEKLIINGNSFDVACKIVLDKFCEWHTWTNEIILMKEMFEKLQIPEIKQNQNTYYTYMPYWHVKGMKLEEYVRLYSYSAQKFVENNSWLLADSIRKEIFEQEITEDDDF